MYRQWYIVSAETTVVEDEDCRLLTTLAFVAKDFSETCKHLERLAESNPHVRFFVYYMETVTELKLLTVVQHARNFHAALNYGRGENRAHHDAIMNGLAAIRTIDMIDKPACPELHLLRPSGMPMLATGQVLCDACGGVFPEASVTSVEVDGEKITYCRSCGVHVETVEERMESRSSDGK